MHAVIAWSGFLGAWLLVAGPLFQAAIELDVEEDQRESMTRAVQRAGPQPSLSPWWWLLPPVAYVLQRRRRRDYRRRLFDASTPEQVETFIEFSNVSTGWAMVAAGAFFIAVKETYEVGEIYHWPLWLFGFALLLMVALCAGHTVLRIKRAHAILGTAAEAS